MKVTHTRTQKHERDKLIMLTLMMHSLYSVHVDYFGLQHAIDLLMTCHKLHSLIHDYRLEYSSSGTDIKLFVTASKNSHEELVVHFSNQP
jgi:hypothetical protein